VEIKQLNINELEDLAKDNPEILQAIEGKWGKRAVRHVQKPHKYPRVSEKQVQIIKRMKHGR
jgi:hypothetical protein